MKYTCFFLLLIFTATACNKTAKQLNEKLAGSDSVAINYFKGDGTMDTVVTVKIIRDKKEVDELIELVTDGSSDKKSDCGVDGSLHFFKLNRVIQDVDFRMNKEGCNQFTYALAGGYHAAKLSAKANELLLQLKKL